MLDVVIAVIRAVVLDVVLWVTTGVSIVYSMIGMYRLTRADRHPLTSTQEEDAPY